MSIRAGFIGLGNIGAPMARRIVEAGIETSVFDVRPEACKELEAAGAEVSASCQVLAAASDVIGVCVRDDAQIHETVLAKDGALAGARPGSVIALHSTILPKTVKAVAEAASPREVDVIDAPITGGAVGAQRGTLTYMVGGEANALERARPVLETSAAQIVHVGPLGSGAAVKLCNNLMTYLGFTAAFEANRLAQEVGLPLEALDSVTRSNGNMSDQMLAFLALHRANVDRSDAGFQSTLRGLVDLADKDLSLALELAREADVELPGTEHCRQILARVYGLED